MTKSKEQQANEYIKRNKIDKSLQDKIKEKFKLSNLGTKKIYGIYDQFMGFQQVFLGQNDGQVCRDIMSAIKTAKEQNQPSPLKDFPENFSIYLICEIDETEGVVKQISEKVIEITDLIEMYK